LTFEHEDLAVRSSPPGHCADNEVSVNSGSGF